VRIKQKKRKQLVMGKMRGEASWDEALLHGRMKEQDRRSCVHPLPGILSLLMNIGHLVPLVDQDGNAFRLIEKEERGL
jgi:hypothetical protein